jgi:hypothetical protein
MPGRERPDLSRSGHSRRDMHLVPGAAGLPCRCGAVATIVTPHLLGRALWFWYRARMRFWCQRCYDRSARLGFLLGRAIGWAIGLAVLGGAAWWRLHR